MFKNAKVGDRVVSIECGEGIITEVDNDPTYPIIVDFEGSQGCYTIDGYYHTDKIELKTPMTKPQCATQAEVFEQFARVSRLIEGTELKLKDVFKYDGKEALTDVIAHSLRSEKYSFALALVEGKPVFVGDTLYLTETVYGKSSVEITGIDKNTNYLTCLGGIAKLEILTWQVPKRTFTINGEELPLPTDKNGGSPSESTVYYLTSDIQRFRWDSVEDRDRVQGALEKLLSRK